MKKVQNEPMHTTKKQVNQQKSDAVKITIALSWIFDATLLMFCHWIDVSKFL